MVGAFKKFSKNRVLVILIGFISFFGNAQNGIPEPTNKLYYNFSTQFPDFLSTEEAKDLEEDLEKFAMSTSNEIVVIVVDDLAGYTPVEYAAKLGDQWGVGQGKEDNGIVIVIKPSGGQGERQTFIATGRGLEGAIPDYTCKEIVDNEMLPNFKNGEYYKGIKSAVKVLEKLSKGEYNKDQYSKKNSKKNNIVVVLIILFVIILVVIAIARGKGGGGGGSGRGFTMGSSGIFFGGGGYRGGGGGFGGGSSGGGFGGFGGGSFGGGGAGGSW